MRRPWYTYTTGLKDALGREIPDEAFENDASYNPKAAEHYWEGFLQRAIGRSAAAPPPLSRQRFRPGSPRIKEAALDHLGSEMAVAEDSATQACIAWRFNLFAGYSSAAPVVASCPLKSPRAPSCLRGR